MAGNKTSIARLMRHLRILDPERQLPVVGAADGLLMACTFPVRLRGLAMDKVPPGQRVFGNVLIAGCGSKHRS